MDIIHAFLFEDTGEAFHQRSDLIYGAYHLPRCIYHFIKVKLSVRFFKLGEYA